MNNKNIHSTHQKKIGRPVSPGLVLIILLFSTLSSLAQPAKKIVPQEAMQATYEKIKTPYKYGMVLMPTADSLMIDCPSVFRRNSMWFMTYIVFDGTGYETWLAESDDLLHWETKGRLMSFSDSTDWDMNQKAGYVALRDEQ